MIMDGRKDVRFRAFQNGPEMTTTSEPFHQEGEMTYWDVPQGRAVLRVSAGAPMPGSKAKGSKCSGQRYPWILPWKFNSKFAPENKPGPKRKGSSSNHHFSGGELLNFRGVCFFGG